MKRPWGRGGDGDLVVGNSPRGVEVVAWGEAGVEVVVGWDPVVAVEWDPPVAAGCPVAPHDERQTAKPPTAPNPMIIRRLRPRKGMLLINRL